jgi:predicted phosphodiesterase
MSLRKRFREAINSLFFYGIDSNLYEEGNIAIGKVSPATLAWLGEQLEQSGSVGSQQDKSVRILLLHHHPADLNKFRRRSWNPYKVIEHLLMDRLTVLEEGERLLKICHGKIDLIMHGHEHFPIVFLNQESGCIIISAGTTSEWQSDSGRNSFHAVAFQGREFRIVQFNWNKAQFKPCLEWIGNFDLPGYNLKCHRIS